ncbi:MAG: helix-turn-helix domain-containing protein [Alphaproteobacteria bacterium]|nr:MAG: helix-turn-helix domain-containing protein [Alphaproteobacteria bacterium]
MTDPLVLTAAQVAQMLQVEEKDVVRLRNQRRIPVVKFGRHIRFRIEDVRAFLDGAVLPCLNHAPPLGLDESRESRTGTSIATTHDSDGSNDGQLALIIARRLKKGLDVTSSNCH